jgi:hypothetical protein
MRDGDPRRSPRVADRMPVLRVGVARSAILRTCDRRCGIAHRRWLCRYTSGDPVLPVYRLYTYVGCSRPPTRRSRLNASSSKRPTHQKITSALVRLRSVSVVRSCVPARPFLVRSRFRSGRALEVRSTGRASRPYAATRRLTGEPMDGAVSFNTHPARGSDREWLPAASGYSHPA